MRCIRMQQLGIYGQKEFVLLHFRGRTSSEKCAIAANRRSCN